MKLPTYYIKEAVYVDSPHLNDPNTEFPPGTLVFPFWNPQWLPSHRREELKQAIKLRTGWNDPNVADLVMCLIGSYWVAVERSIICRRD